MLRQLTAKQTDELLEILDNTHPVWWEETIDRYLAQHNIVLFRDERDSIGNGMKRELPVDSYFVSGRDDE